MTHAADPRPEPPPPPPTAPAPWISRDLYAAEEVTLGLRRYRVEVRAFRMDVSRPAEPCYCVYRLDEGRWTHLRPSSRAPERVVRRGSALVAAAEGIDLSTASYGRGETIDRTAAGTPHPGAHASGRPHAPADVPGYCVWTTLDGGRQAAGPADVGTLLRRDSSSVFFTPRPGAPALADDGRAAGLAPGSVLHLAGLDARYVPWSATLTRTRHGFGIDEGL